MFLRETRDQPRSTEEPDRAQRAESRRNSVSFPKFCDGYPAKRVRRAIWNFWVNLWE